MENRDPETDQLIEDEDPSVKTTDSRLRNPNLVGVSKKDIDKGGQYYYRADGLDDSEAREENFFWSICLCFCPTITWKQFIVWVSLFEILVFIISCSIYGVRNDAFLAPDPHALEMLGWQDARKIKNGW